jgi:hypothetical protein
MISLVRQKQLYLEKLNRQMLSLSARKQKCTELELHTSKMGARHQFMNLFILYTLLGHEDRNNYALFMGL